MAKQPRKPAEAKPITTHQLFPAVVALWFGALFGLGSLAVRPSLLESLVIKSRIDLIVSAAAPPLGVTARIFVALILAVIGSALGIAIARRITRPKVEQRERKRTAFASDPSEARPRHRTTNAEPSTRPPLSMADEVKTDVAPKAGTLAQRRRALTVEHERQDFVPYETAPLPGGAPQILDISQVGMTAASTEEASPTIVSTSVELQTSAVNPAPVAEFAAIDDRQVFGASPKPAMSEAAKQIFGQVIEGDHVSEDFIKAAGFQTSVFETPEPSPLFAPREAPVQAEPASPVAVPQVYVVPEAPAVSDYQVPPSAELAAMVPESTPVAPAAIAPQSQPIAADLGMTDLAGRLAESMARRRAARNSAAQAVVPAPVVEEQTVNEAATVPTIASPMPQAYETPMVAAPLPPVLEAPPFAAPVPQTYEPAPIEAARSVEPEIEPVPASPPIPQAMRPLDLDGFEEDDDHLYSLLPPRHIPMPVPAEPVAFEPAPPLTAVSDEPETAETEVAEANYASLLEIAPAVTTPAPSFVRIDEPDVEAAAVEPVVIFPGQMIRQTEVDADSSGFRRFDAPATAGQGGPIAANQSAPEVDREESERALRMALANLQRMSGAA